MKQPAIKPSAIGWGQKIGAMFDKAIARLSNYDAGLPTITRTQRSWVGSNPNSIYAQIQRNNMQWNADYIAKNVAFAIGYLKIRRNYCSPQGWSPNTGDKQLDLDVKAYCDEQWKDMGVNCSMWTAFSRTADVELPTRGDSALVWYRDESRLKLMEVSADQIGELFFYQNPVTEIDGLTYFAGMYFDKYGTRQAMKVYQRGWADNYIDPEVYPASDVIYFQDNLVRGVRGVTTFHGAIESITKAGKLWQYGMDAAQKQAKTAVVMSNEYGGPTGQQYRYETETGPDGGVVIIEKNFDGAETQFQYNGDGYELIQTTAPGSELINGCRYADEQASLSLAMPYAFLVNAASEGGAPYRGELGKAGKEINRITRLHEDQFKKIAYVTIMDAVQRGVFTGSALGFDLTAGNVTFPSLPTADSYREATEDLKYVRAGLDSPQRVLARYRENPFEVLNENKEWAKAVAKAVQDSNKELEKEGYDPTISNVDIAQPMDNMQQAATAEQLDAKGDAGKESGKVTDNPANATMSAFIADIPIRMLPASTQQDIKNIIPLVSDTTMVTKHGMVASELEPMADPHNLESARKNIRYCTNGNCADEVHGNTEKHIIVNNGRIVDGHHHLAKALKGKVTKSLSVVDISPIRFQTATLSFDESKHPRASDGKFGHGMNDADDARQIAEKLDPRKPESWDYAPKGSRVRQLFAEYQNIPDGEESEFIKKHREEVQDYVYGLRDKLAGTAKLAEWDESKHPRRDNGEFGNGVNTESDKSTQKFRPIIAGNNLIHLTSRSDTQKWQVTAFEDESMRVPNGHDGFDSLPKALSHAKYDGDEVSQMLGNIENSKRLTGSKDPMAIYFDALKQNPAASDQYADSTYVYSSPLRPMSGVKLSDASAQVLNVRTQSGIPSSVIIASKPISISELRNLDLAPIDKHAKAAMWKDVADEIYPGHDTSKTTRE